MPGLEPFAPRRDRQIEVEGKKGLPYKSVVPVPPAAKRFWYLPKATTSVARKVEVRGTTTCTEVIALPVPEGIGAVIIRDCLLQMRPFSELDPSVLAGLATANGDISEMTCCVCSGDVGISVGSQWAGMDLPRAIATANFRLGFSTSNQRYHIANEREGFQQRPANGVVLWPDKNGLFLMTIVASNYLPTMPAATAAKAVVEWDVMVRWDPL